MDDSIGELEHAEAAVNIDAQYYKEETKVYTRREISPRSPSY